MRWTFCALQRLLYSCRYFMISSWALIYTFISIQYIWRWASWTKIILTDETRWLTVCTDLIIIISYIARWALPNTSIILIKVKVLQTTRTDIQRLKASFTGWLALFTRSSNRILQIIGVKYFAWVQTRILIKIVFFFAFCTFFKGYALLALLLA